MLRAASLAILSASILLPQISSDALHIEANLQGHDFAPREQVAIQFAVTNRSQRHVTAPDPSRGPALRVRLRTPSGEKRFSIADAARTPGVPDIAGTWGLPPGVRRVFEFDVAALAHVAAPGSYTATLEYAAPGGTPWKSPAMSFTIAPPAGAFLEVMESEASRRGPDSILWTEREGGGARALVWPVAMTGGDGEVWGAVSAAGVPAGAHPLLSVSPSGQDFPDRWLVWLDGPQLRYLYRARDPSAALPPSGIAVPADARLIRAPLADAAPASGRPACHVAWLSGANLQRAAIDGRGRARLLPPVPLGGEVEGAWAISPRSGERVYVAALRAGEQTQVVSIRCQGETCAAPVVRFRMPGRTAAGDLRVVGAETVAAFVLSRASDWARVTLRLAPGAVPRSDALPPGSHADSVRVRLDSAGAAHVVLAESAQFRYFRPGSDAPARIPRPGPLFDLMAGPQGPQLVVYDPARGPAFLALPR